jgi:hypothetical protein
MPVTTGLTTPVLTGGDDGNSMLVRTGLMAAGLMGGDSTGSSSMNSGTVTCTCAS